MTTEKQPELFGEFKDLETKNKLFGKGIFPEKTFTFTFSRDKLILVGLGFIVLLATIFALGFEQGKRKASIKRVITMPALKAKQEILTAAPALEAKKSAAQPESKPYTIQVATFKSKELAQQEVSKLKKKGFSTTITITAINGLYQIWTGEFADYKEASQTLSTLKKIYKDCYIRKR